VAGSRGLRGIAVVAGVVVLVAGLTGCGDGGRKEHEEALAAYSASVDDFEAKRAAYDEAHAKVAALVAPATAARTSVPADDPVATALDAQLALVGEADPAAVVVVDTSDAPKDVKASTTELREATEANAAAAARLAKQTTADTASFTALEPLTAEAVLVDRIVKWEALDARWHDMVTTKLVPKVEEVAQYCKSIGEFQILPQCLDRRAVFAEAPHYGMNEWTHDNAEVNTAETDVAAAVDRSTLTGAEDATARAAQVEAVTARVAAQLEVAFAAAATMP
jgi:hypothetical protein